jgi:hypothetical protein
MSMELQPRVNPMSAPPPEFGRAKVIWLTPIDSRHRPTGNCRHLVGARLLPPASALAICRYPDDEGYYLCHFDRAWEEITDTWHPTIDEAKEQAEFEYEGVSGTWQEA